MSDEKKSFWSGCCCFWGKKDRGTDSASVGLTSSSTAVPTSSLPSTPVPMELRVLSASQQLSTPPGLSVLPPTPSPRTQEQKSSDSPQEVPLTPQSPLSQPLMAPPPMAETWGKSELDLENMYRESMQPPFFDPNITESNPAPYPDEYDAYKYR